jgi:succinate dehydrogenase / fumarate reductase cytochrome b subunit
VNNIRKRPVNLALTTIRFPSTAIVSILHRLSGVILFLFIPLFILLLASSLNPVGFETIQDYLTHPFNRFILWGVLSAFLFHLVAGIRHLLMDAHIGDGRESGKATAWGVFAISIILILLLGIWLW